MTTMHHDDADIQKRHDKVAASRTFKNLCDSLGLRQARVLDAGCGYGEYLAAFGPGSVGITTTPAEVAYGKAHNLDIVLGNVEDVAALRLSPGFGAVWANNLFEHLLAPHAFLISLKTVVAQDGRIVLGVPMVPVLPSFFFKIKRFRGALASNHINFFNRHTFRLTVQFAGWTVEDVRPFIFKSRWLDRIFSPVAPHLYLVARNNPDFAYPEKKMKEWENDPRYAHLIAIAGPKQ
jgi:SAM-dependent methyltransferase